MGEFLEKENTRNKGIPQEWGNNREKRTPGIKGYPRNEGILRKENTRNKGILQGLGNSKEKRTPGINGMLLET